MTDIETIHPPADRLTAYAQGRLIEPDMDEIEQHLSCCDSCCQWIRDQPEDSLVARLRGRGAAPVAPPATGAESATEPPTGFQVPSSFVVVGADRALDDQPTIAGPPPDASGLARLPKALNDHPRYRVIDALGDGGMGTVYRAEHRLMDRPVALKVIRSDLLGNQALVERFRREVKSAARLASHPNIVVAYDAEQAGETHMLVMEFVEGTDLARLVDRRGPLPVGEACEYARQAALGLQHAFEDGMFHRDIKPQNLMRTTRGQIKVLDFGLARFASEVGSRAEVTAEGMVLGSADYIAPEQIDNPHAADIRADIYSLGSTLYFLLAGHPPFADGSLIQKLMAHGEKTPRPLAELRADLPTELAQIVDRMMAKDPARRFQTPGEVAQALTPFFKQGSVAVREATPDISRVGPPLAKQGSANAVSVPIRAPTEIAPGTAPAARKPSDATRPGSILEGLIDLPETDPLFDMMLDTPRPAAGPELIPRGHSAQTTAVAKRRGLGPRGWWVAAGVFLIGLFVAWAAVIFKIKTEHGVIVLENVPENAVVEVDGDRVTVTPTGSEPITIAGQAGKHVVVVKRGDDVLLGENVTFESGKQLNLTVRLEPREAPRTGNADTDDGASRSEDSKPRIPASAEVSTTSPTSPATPISKTDRARAWHRLMSRQGTKAEGPAPMACWTFESDAHDDIGTTHGRLFDGASVREGRLCLDGAMAHLKTEPLSQDVREKTLEAWVALSNLSQRGGGVISIEHGFNFDAIVYGEHEPAKWTAGSTDYIRTKDLDASVETAKPSDLIHMAIVYDLEGGITVYREGKRYAERYVPAGGRPSLRTYRAGESHVLLGERHTAQTDFLPGFLTGAIEEARLYDRALTADEVAASYRAGIIH
jgi:serine/threonine protein kinase